ncbi:unnamed protein product [Adineta ricciae]|uniref:B box-type domain-containing protein n=1 Tax=Adineta ricciae TaxID=249248 RepID=A0A813VVS6_ADIRI|nr:unnamed protein product [Adineta ricciae]
MASAATTYCRQCDSGSYRCDDCRRTFCDYHFTEHRQQIVEQFDRLQRDYSNLNEILSLPPSYESLAGNTDLINKVDQWEADAIRQVKEIAEQTRDKIRSRADSIPNDRFGTAFHQLTEQFQQTQLANTYSELDIQRLATQLNNLKIQVENSSLTTADLQVLPIDWSKYLQITTKQPNLPRIQQQDFHFDWLLTTKARLSLDVKGSDWHMLGTSSPQHSTFLHYQHTKKHRRLSIINHNGQQKLVPWYDDQAVWDSCWSSYLNKFLILADNRLYTYDDEIETSDSMQLIESVQPKRDEMEFLRCTCSNDTLLIAYDERNTSIDEYKMTPWRRVHEYANIVKPNEIIMSLTFSMTNSNLIGMTLLDDRQQWHFELRDRSMSLISAIQLDKSEFNRRIISLPNLTFNWLIIHTGSKYLTVLNENAQSKRTIECAENVDLTTYVPKRNSLVLLTQKSKLKFFDL